MRDEILKPATIRVPVLLHREPGRGGQWRGWPDIGDDAARDYLDARGSTEAETRRALPDLVATALRHAMARPILVIGGEPYYAGCVHVINPEPYGWVVYSIRDGRQSGSWHSAHGPNTLLAQVLEHVGGQPAVVRL
ncbi:hypothetical protein [Actinoplanes regularis]|uniref:Uncharacterized protein n=1 Tax=Actinoplanes regularis TaxID=52697 RepID=A0A238XK57_9ACTN|nr:hypothetical protein [Actinoplanes regularis]GIE90506.1 hypothetical protein Are01nite_69860 [Actinoplanes regularis]SNR58853.1 hypothetical protein SAMN06264365_103498 [Actinoplanes regularis]